MYSEPDPRRYFQVLGGLDYSIPEQAYPVFAQIVDHLIAVRRRPITVLDLGCSYGINAALLKRQIPYKHLRHRYTSPVFAGLSPVRMAYFDKCFYYGWPARKDLKVIGIDASEPAIEYAAGVGLLDDGLAVNLESEALDERAAAFVAEADLVISTGCVGYVTAATFERLLSAFGDKRAPWVASFVLRVFSYEEIAARLAKHGLVTQRFGGATFIQRRFQDEGEYRQMLGALQAAGVDPSWKEAEGALHAELFVSRPSNEANNVDLTDFISVSCGEIPADRRFFHQVRQTPAAAA